MLETGRSQLEEAHVGVGVGEAEVDDETVSSRSEGRQRLGRFEIPPSVIFVEEVVWRV